MHTELLCFRATEIPDNTRPPDWIMFAPAGQQTISARLDGKERVLPVTVDAATADALQRDLQARLAAGGPAPFFDFHHDARDASGYPQAFEWRPDGVWVRVQWTPAGAAAITAAVGQRPTIRYFSPRANYDERTGRITGLLPAAAGNAAGGLVSDPAFQSISPLTAAKAAAGADPTGTTNTDTTTTKMDYSKIIQALVASGLMTQEECDGAEAGTIATQRLGELTAMKPKAMACAKAEEEATRLQSELTAAKAEVTRLTGDAADAFVRELQCSGKIPPKATETAGLWKSQFLANPDAARRAAAELTASRTVTAGALTTDDDGAASGTPPPPVDFSAVSVRARELLASRSASTWDTAFDMATNEARAALAAKA